MAQALRLLRQAAQGSQQRCYRFRKAVVRKAVVSHMLPKRRRSWHASAHAAVAVLLSAARQCSNSALYRTLCNGYTAACHVIARHMCMHAYAKTQVTAGARAFSWLL